MTWCDFNQAAVQTHTLFHFHSFFALGGLVCVGEKVDSTSRVNVEGGTN